MKNILFVLIICLTVLGCKDDKPTTLTVNFKAVYDGAPLLLDEITEYNYYDGSAIKLTGLRFFLSDVKLYAGSNATEIISVEDIDFTTNNKTSTGADEGQSIIIEDPEIGEYDKIEFSVGVTAIENAKTTTDFGYDHPLGPSNQSEYWDSWDSYIFAKIEGRQDANGDGSFDSFTYHTGIDQMYRTTTITKTITVVEEEDTMIQFEIDAKDIFSNGLTTVDIVGEPIIHTLPTNPASMSFSEMISDNLINAISIK